MGSAWIYILVIAGAGVIAWIANRFDSEGRLLRDIARREPLDDRTFQERFYPADDTCSCVASDVRRLCAKHVGLDPERLLPHDDLQMLFCELDVAPLVKDIQAEFHCNARDDSARTPYNLAHLIEFVALNGRARTDATSPSRQ